MDVGWFEELVARHAAVTVDLVTVQLPWGSLLRGLLEADPRC